MKVITNNKDIAIEVVSTQDLFHEDIEEITILGIGSHKYGLNNYDAEVKIKDMKFVLYRDLSFENVNIKNILNTDISNINFEIIK